MDLLKSVMDAFQIPQDAAARYSFLQICGNCQVKLENYTRMIDYSPNRLLLQCKTCQIEISGRELQILRYSSQELVLEGVIQKVMFL